MKIPLKALAVHTLFLYTYMMGMQIGIHSSAEKNEIYRQLTSGNQETQFTYKKGRQGKENIFFLGEELDLGTKKAYNMLNSKKKEEGYVIILPSLPDSEVPTKEVEPFKAMRNLGILTSKLETISITSKNPAKRVLAYRIPTFKSLQSKGIAIRTSRYGGTWADISRIPRESLKSNNSKLSRERQKTGRHTIKELNEWKEIFSTLAREIYRLVENGWGKAFISRYKQTKYFQLNQGATNYAVVVPRDKNKPKTVRLFPFFIADKKEDPKHYDIFSKKMMMENFLKAFLRSVLDDQRLFDRGGMDWNNNEDMAPEGTTYYEKLTESLKIYFSEKYYPKILMNTMRELNLLKGQYNSLKIKYANQANQIQQKDQQLNTQANQIQDQANQIQQKDQQLNTQANLVRTQVNLLNTHARRVQTQANQIQQRDQELQDSRANVASLTQQNAAKDRRLQSTQKNVDNARQVALYAFIIVGASVIYNVYTWYSNRKKKKQTYIIQESGEVLPPKSQVIGGFASGLKNTN